MDEAQTWQKIDNWLIEGEAWVKAGQRGRARRLFARVLALQPDNVRALVWLASLADDPRQSIACLERVLKLAPNHSDAQKGLHWAHRRLADQNARAQKMAWLDTILISSLAVMALIACVILIWVFAQTPGVARAAYDPTATISPPQTPTHTPTSIPTYTPMPTFTPTSTPTATPVLEPTATATLVVPGDPSGYTARGEKWIQIDLSDQILTAYEGETEVLSALVSTGVARFPTPIGEHAIFRKVRSQVMSGPGYYLPNVEYVSYFYKGYAIHGTYWHNNFGYPMSHGCVNMTNEDAKWIFEWAPGGTRVLVQN
ncbi:MAG: L,D-transpeptidase family protein [Anaerolineae bacterium]|nr:L,D-transpeptidase family protein [Anaerolineae bacterium]